MKHDPITINVAINTQGAAATDDQRAQALAHAVHLASVGNIHPSAVLDTAAKYADFLCGNGIA